MASSAGLGRLNPIAKAIIKIAQMCHSSKWRMSSKRGEVCCSYEAGEKEIEFLLPIRVADLGCRNPISGCWRIKRRYFFSVTLIDLGLAASDLGSVSVSTPFSNSALALSEATLAGSESVRWNEPMRRSLRR